MRGGIFYTMIGHFTKYDPSDSSELNDYLTHAQELIKPFILNGHIDWSPLRLYIMLFPYFGFLLTSAKGEEEECTRPLIVVTNLPSIFIIYL